MLAEAIRGNSSSQGLDELLRLFHSNSPLLEDPRVRRNLAEALGIICGPPAVASPFVRLVLLRLTQDSEPGVREAAETSLNSFIQVGTPLGKEWRSLVPFEFQTVTLDARGNEVQRHTLMARQFLEDLAPDVFLEMVEVPGGTFVMGSPESEEGRQSREGPQREVSVPPFFIGKFTITQAQWRVVAGWEKVEIDLNPKPSHFKGDDRPVDSVSWLNVKEFCARLSKKTGRAYRLPSEAEWEYACRAGTTTPFAFGETITPEIVNYDGNYPYANAKKGKYRNETIPVGSLGVANAFGLYDMHGNVWEWCEDAFVDNYNDAPVDGSARLSDGDSMRVLRGGSCFSHAVLCRSAYRVRYGASIIDHYVGVRVVVSARTS